MKRITTLLAAAWLQASAANGRLGQMHPSLASSVAANLESLKDRLFYIPQHVVISPPADVDEIYQKPGCPIAGLM